MGKLLDKEAISLAREAGRETRDAEHFALLITPTAVCTDASGLHGGSGHWVLAGEAHSLVCRERFCGRLQTVSSDTGKSHLCPHHKAKSKLPL